MSVEADGCAPTRRASSRVSSISRTRTWSARRGSSALPDGRPRDPRRLLGRGDGCLPRPRRTRDRRRGAAQAEKLALHLLPPLHKRAAGATRRAPARAAAPEMARVRFVSGRLGGERDDAAARRGSTTSTAASAERWRVDLAGAGLPRRDDGRACAHRPAGPAGAVRQVRAAITCTCRRAPGGSIQRRGRARGARSGDRGGRPGNRRSLHLRAGQRCRLARLLAARLVLGGLAERRERYGFLVCFDEIVTGMGRRGAGSPTSSCRSSRTSSPPEGPRSRLFPARRGALPASTSTTRSPRARANSSTATPGTARRSPARSGSPCSTRFAEQGWSSAFASAARACEAELEAAVGGLDIVREVRGRGFLLGVELVDPARR